MDLADGLLAGARLTLSPTHATAAVDPKETFSDGYATGVERSIGHPTKGIPGGIEQGLA
jgi:hypothetical protein